MFFHDLAGLLFTPSLSFPLMLTQFLFLLSTIFFFVSPLLSPAINSPLSPAFFLLYFPHSPSSFFPCVLFSSLSLTFPSHSLSFFLLPPLTLLVPQLHRLSNKPPFNRTPSFIFHLCQSPWSCLRESNPPANSSFLFFLFPL